MTPIVQQAEVRFLSETEPHPFNHTLRFWRHRVAFEVYFKSDYVRLGAIIAVFPGMGDGSKALDWLAGLGAPVRGHVSRIGKKGLNAQQLRAWYRRHGAVFEKGGHFVIYKSCKSQ